MENQNQNENQMNIELSEETALGVYSNLAIITHSPAEFVCDFVQIMPGMPKGKVRSRIIMTPENAKRFMKALRAGASTAWNRKRTAMRGSLMRAMTRGVSTCQSMTSAPWPMATPRRPSSGCAQGWPCTASGIQRSHSCSVQPYSRSNDAGTGWEGVEEKEGEADDT
jgi:hypothetical protein